MTTLDVALLVLGWMAGWLLFGRPRRLAAPAPSSAAAPTGRVSVIIPARDEAARLPSLLAALAAAEPRPDEVIVVDDGSTDATGAVAAAHGATVVTADALAPGWTGKAAACWQGAATATGEILVFLDADTEPRPHAVAAVAAEAARTGGLVSVQPWHRVERPYEQASAMANLVSVLGAGTGGPRRRSWWRAPMAFGPCLALPARVYARIGGHAAVATSVADDVALAERADRAGVGVTALLGEDVIAYRMYPDGWRSLVQGWTKNLATGAGAVPPLRLLAVVVWIGAALRAAVLVPGALAGGSLGAVTVAAAAYAAYAGQCLRLLTRLGRFTPAAVVYPLALLAFFFLFARSVVATRLRREVRWRGRAVPIGPRP